jgi:hypothetical protein
MRVREVTVIDRLSSWIAKLLPRRTEPEPALWPCEAAIWGGTHTCQCVYAEYVYEIRREVIGEHDYHLCMCGADWITDAAE